MTRVDVGFPDGWVSARPIDHEIFRHDDLDDAFVIVLLLEDSVNLAAAVFDGGRRFARVRALEEDRRVPPLEEHFTGQAAPDGIDEIWAVVVNTMAKSIGQVAREMGLRS